MQSQSSKSVSLPFKTNSMTFQEEILQGIPGVLPEMQPYDPAINHAPVRKDILSPEEKRLAVKNALRYFDAAHHEILSREFADELSRFGRIYMYRFMPRHPIFARPIHEYPHRSVQAAAIMLMIQNNLDPAVAQHPHELITYGGNGAVFQNWAQYRITMRYLAEMTDEQTLVMYSGHPLGLFPSHKEAPRAVVTNGMMIPNYSKPDDWERYNALGVTQYGQMTAGSYMYIGPQGIVHGTTITILNAARKKSSSHPVTQSPSHPLTHSSRYPAAPQVFVSSGLGGMSGAQAKAAVIAGAIAVVAEVNPKAVSKRHSQGWIDEVYFDLDSLIDRMMTARKKREAVSLAYEGNVVDLWERFAAKNIPVELGSDQTSLHNPWAGGYYPAEISFEESNELMVKDPVRFRKEVQKSLRRQVKAINMISSQGMYFWDYGNAFLLESGRAGAKVFRPDGTFMYPSYVQDIMGPLFFDYGFGPFRWVCTSGRPEELEVTDQIALNTLEKIARGASREREMQLRDNIHWIREAGRNKLVVGSQARILYADCE